MRLLMLMMMMMMMMMMRVAVVVGFHPFLSLLFLYLSLYVGAVGQLEQLLFGL